MYQLDTYPPIFTRLKGTGIRCLKLSYTSSGENPITLRSLKYAISYVLHKLDFQPMYLPEPNQSDDPAKTLLEDQSGNELLLLIEKAPARNGLSRIVFNTDNCLRDYHRYISLGVEFTSRPEYCEWGLKVDFLAPDDSVYTLLEKRVYSDDI